MEGKLFAKLLVRIVGINKITEVITLDQMSRVWQQNIYCHLRLNDGTSLHHHEFHTCVTILCFTSGSKSCLNVYLLSSDRINKLSRLEDYEEGN